MQCLLRHLCYLPPCYACIFASGVQDFCQLIHYLAVYYQGGAIKSLCSLDFVIIHILHLMLVPQGCGLSTSATIAITHSSFPVDEAWSLFLFWSNHQYSFSWIPD